MRRLLIVALLVGLLFFGQSAFEALRRAAQPVGGASPLPPGVQRLVRLESSKEVFDLLYRYGHDDPAPNGAYGPNITAPSSAWFLESQRAGGYDIIAGALRHDPSLIAEGLRMLDFGLVREAPDGSFPGSAWPFHGTAFFLSETAPALVLLSASPYQAQFSAEIRWEAQRMRRAAYHMVSVVGGPGKIDDSTKNHRFYEAAIALGGVGTLSKDQKLIGWSATYAWEGIRMERPDGVMPEDGGHDSGYQALGMVNASRYLELNASGKLYRALYLALQRGERWELSRIGPDGTVNQQGDTRTAGCQERDPAGQCKTVFYDPIYSALAREAVISGDQRYAQAAHLVWLRSQRPARA